MRPARKARGGRISGIFNRRATQRAGMQRRPNAKTFLRHCTSMRGGTPRGERMRATTRRTAVRLERDSLGSLAVPADAYYGIQTRRAMLNFPISGRRLPPVFIHAYARIKPAAAGVNVSLGLLDHRRGAAIRRAAAEVLAGRHLDQFVVDVYQAGAGTSQNMNLNEVLANRAIEILGGRRSEYSVIHPNDHVNMSQ